MLRNDSKIKKESKLVQVHIYDDAEQQLNSIAMKANVSEVKLDDDLDLVVNLELEKQSEKRRMIWHHRKSSSVPSLPSITEETLDWNSIFNLD